LASKAILVALLMQKFKYVKLMKSLPIVIAFVLMLTAAKAQQVFPTAENQIKLAQLAAPEDKRADATVYGYSPKGEVVLLKQGKNELICLADDPKQEGLSVACYHIDLEPFMKRGRELKAALKPDTRDDEVKAGTLQMPNQPTSLYVYSAKPGDFDASQGSVKKGYLRYVIYTPYATAESTGLSLQPAGGGVPWLMFPGTPRAHIMINP
jgi:hypothetical protein